MSTDAHSGRHSLIAVAEDERPLGSSYECCNGPGDRPAETTAGRRNAFELLRPVDPQGSVVQGDRGRIYDSARGQALPMSELGCKRPQAAQTAEDR